MLSEVIQSADIVPLLLEELKIGKLTASSKKEVFQILGVLLKLNTEILPSVIKEVKETLLRVLYQEVCIAKTPKIPMVIGSLKGIFHFLFSHQILDHEGNTLFNCQSKKLFKSSEPPFCILQMLRPIKL